MFSIEEECKKFSLEFCEIRREYGFSTFEFPENYYLVTTIVDEAYEQIVYDKVLTLSIGGSADDIKNNKFYGSIHRGPVTHYKGYKRSCFSENISKLYYWGGPSWYAVVNQSTFFWVFRQKNKPQKDCYFFHNVRDLIKEVIDID